MNYHSILLLFASLCASISHAQPQGYGFGKQIEISPNLVSGNNDLTDFPFYLQLTDPDLRTISNGGNIQNSQGFDMLFTLPDCVTPLFFQIESYDPASGSLIAWIRIPVLSASLSTRVFLYYGNASISTDPSSSSTWNGNYEGVWHMNNDPSNSALIDYSGNGVNGASFGGMTSTDLVAGKLGNAIDFDGNNDYFALANKFYTNQGEIPQIAVSAWINTTFSNGNSSSNWSILDFDRSEYFNMFIHGDGRLGFATRAGGINDSYAGTAGDLNDGNWHYVVGVYNGTNKLLYIDGNLALTVNNAHNGVSLGTGANRFGFIGDGSEATTFNGNRNNRYYDGIYDEIRFSSAVLTSDWIGTEYTNQNNPSSFYVLTEEQLAGNLCLLLPVAFGTLSAQLTQERQVQLTWNTISEINNDYFEVLRSENDLDWEIIDIVDGAGNSLEEQHYQSLDISPGWDAGINYYRIRQVDFNGAYKYSPTRSVHLQSTSEVLIYPNPAKDVLYIEGATHNLSSEIIVTNELGQSMIGKISFIQVSKHQIQLDLSNLSTGMYLIQVNGTQSRIFKR
ncbi:MAG: DUF2341 domain-containing protein [Crocinitomicaceae bacterium]|nr:DUF2341 domain-containing protein [Crocinitomicaceae bacterium]